MSTPRAAKASKCAAYAAPDWPAASHGFSDRRHDWSCRRKASADLPASPAGTPLSSSVPSGDRQQFKAFRPWSRSSSGTASVSPVSFATATRVHGEALSMRIPPPLVSLCYAVVDLLPTLLLVVGGQVPQHGRRSNRTL